MPARIAPLEPPYEPSTGELLARMMPSGQPPIGLFRTFARNPTMTEAMHDWGRYVLSRRFSVSMREREIVIDRVCARCGCEYEWGVHVAYFAERVGLTREQIASLTYGRPDDPCWTEPHERALIAAVDALHEQADLDDAQFVALRQWYDDAALLDVVLLGRLVSRHQLRGPRRRRGPRAGCAALRRLPHGSRSATRAARLTLVASLRGMTSTNSIVLGTLYPVSRALA
jgi:alkylhydroperoxidase family enzyme